MRRGGLEVGGERRAEARRPGQQSRGLKVGLEGRGLEVRGLEGRRLDFRGLEVRGLEGCVLGERQHLDLEQSGDTAGDV